MKKKVLVVFSFFLFLPLVQGIEIPSQEFNLWPGENVTFAITLFNEKLTTQTFSLHVQSSSPGNLTCIFEDNITSKNIDLSPLAYYSANITAIVNGGADEGSYQCMLNYDIPPIKETITKTKTIHKTHSIYIENITNVTVEVPVEKIVEKIVEKPVEKKVIEKEYIYPDWTPIILSFIMFLLIGILLGRYFYHKPKNYKHKRKNKKNKN